MKAVGAISPDKVSVVFAVSKGSKIQSELSTISKCSKTDSSAAILPTESLSSSLVLTLYFIVFGVQDSFFLFVLTASIAVQVV